MHGADTRAQRAESTALLRDESYECAKKNQRNDISFREAIPRLLHRQTRLLAVAVRAPVLGTGDFGQRHGAEIAPAKHPPSPRASAYALAAPTDYRLGRHAISYEDNLEIPFQKTMKDILRILFFRRGKTRS